MKRLQSMLRKMRVTVAADRIETRLSQAKIAAALERREPKADIDPVVVSIEAKLGASARGSAAAL